MWLNYTHIFKNSITNRELLEHFTQNYYTASKISETSAFMPALMQRSATWQIQSKSLSLEFNFLSTFAHQTYRLSYTGRV